MELRNLRRPEIRSARVRGNEERNKIEHVEIETGTNKECEVIAPGKIEDQVREDTAGKDEQLEPARLVPGHQAGPAGLRYCKLLCYDLAERDGAGRFPLIWRHFLVSGQSDTFDTGYPESGTVVFH